MKRIKRLGNMKVTPAPIIIGRFGTTSKTLARKMKDVIILRRIKKNPDNSTTTINTNTDKGA